MAAKTSSRDLWILARVVQDYPAFDMDASEFLKLTPVRQYTVYYVVFGVLVVTCFFHLLARIYSGQTRRLVSG